MTSLFTCDKVKHKVLFSRTRWKTWYGQKGRNLEGTFVQNPLCVPLFKDGPIYMCLLNINYFPLPVNYLTAPSLILNDIFISLCFTTFGIFMLMWISHARVLKLDFFPVNLLHITWIIGPAKKTKRGRFPDPDTIYMFSLSYVIRTDKKKEVEPWVLGSCPSSLCVLNSSGPQFLHL